MAANKNKITAQAQKYTAKGQFEKAISEYQKLLRLDAHDIRTRLKMGDLYTRMGARKEATETYLKVAEHYTKSGFHLKAVAIYKQVIKLDATLMNVYDLLADSYMSLGLTSEALIQLEHLANIFQRTEQNDQLLFVLSKMIAADPHNISIRLRIAEQLSTIGNISEAVEQFSVACEYLKQNERMDDYLKVAERLLYHDSSRVDVAREVANLYLEQNQPKRALAKLQICFKRDPKSIDTLELLARAFVKLNQPKKAVSVYEEMARSLAEKGNKNEERRIYEIILAISPNNQTAQNAIGSTHQSVAQPLIRDTGLPSPAFAATKLAQKNADLDATTDLHDKNLAENPDKILGEAEVLIKYGLVDRARDHIEKIFKSDYFNLDARERLKDLYLTENNQAEAITQLFILAEGFIESQPEGSVYYLHQILAIDAMNKRARNMIRKIGGVMPEGLPALPDDEAATEDSSLSGSRQFIQEQPEIEIEADLEVELPADDDFEQLSIDDIPYLEPEGNFNDLNINAKPDANESRPSDNIYELDLNEDYSNLDNSKETAAIHKSSVPPPPRPATMQRLSVPPPPPPRPANLQKSSAPPPPPRLSKPTTPKPAVGKAPMIPVAPPKQKQVLETDIKKPSPVIDELANIEDELEEFEFFASQGLTEEAEGILQALQEQYPNDPRIKEALAALVPQSDNIDDGDSDNDYEDILVLDETIDLDHLSSDVDFDDITDDEVVNEIDEIFSQFKAGVEKQVSTSDFATHYDLGVAYKEMGLFDDAIKEFEIVTGDPQRAATADMMIGVCHASMKRFDEAEKTFKDSLKHKNLETTGKLALMHELGKLYEVQNRVDEALKIYNEVLLQDPGFADVLERIDALDSDEDGSQNTKPSSFS